MLLKQSTVRWKKKKKLFSNAQEKWSDIRHLDGFHGQFGGWYEDEACVFTLWEDRSTYQSFMNGAHDTIYVNSNQEDTFLSCEIELFQTLYDITDTHLKDVVTEGSFVRVAICDVKVEKEKYFYRSKKQFGIKEWKKQKEC